MKLKHQIINVERIQGITSSVQVHMGVLLYKTPVTNTTNKTRILLLPFAQRSSIVGDNSSFIFTLSFYSLSYI